MIKLDDNLLSELGLAALPPEEKKKMLAHIYETLEMRVGMKLAEQMTDAQLDEFEQFINRNDEAGALRWLETNFPHYKEVVAQEFDKLKAEIREVAPQILASAQQAAATQALPQPPQPQPQTHPQQYAVPQQSHPGGQPQHLQAVPSQYQAPYPPQPQQPSPGQQGQGTVQYAAPQQQPPQTPHHPTSHSQQQQTPPQHPGDHHQPPSMPYAA